MKQTKHLGKISLKFKKMKSLVKCILSIILFYLISHSGYSQTVEYDYKVTVHTFNKAWNSGNFDLLDKVVHPDYTKLEGDLVLEGIESLKNYVKEYIESYINLKITYIDEIYGDEKAAINFTIEGTPKETGKSFKAEGIVIFRFREGKIIEDHSVFDQLFALKQQGYTITRPE